MLNTCAWLKRLFIVTSKIMIGIQLHIYPIIRRHHFANQSPYSQSYGFSSRHIQMWELDLKEGRMSKNWCLWISAGEDSWESLGLQRKTSQSYRKSTLNTYWKDWCWTWSSNTLATWFEKLILWKRHWCWEKASLLTFTFHLWHFTLTFTFTFWHWRQKEKEAAEDEMVRWHHWLNGHESEQILGDSEGQGSLAYCSSWVAELDTA